MQTKTQQKKARWIKGKGGKERKAHVRIKASRER